jgi:hypothetical protein
MAGSVGVLFLAGGLGLAVAFLLGLALADTAGRLIALAGLGAVLACCFQLALGADEFADPLARQLMNAAGMANALGWFAGTCLVARVRALEWLETRLEHAGA